MLDAVELDTPIGPVLVAATGEGVAHVAFREADARSSDALLHDVLGDHERAEHGLAEDAARQLEAWFAGERTRLDVPLDWRLARGAYRAQVQRALVRIPRGEVRSYAELAEETGRPRAARAVGSACATNPLPLFAACHRVIRSDGTIGPYGVRLGLERGVAVKRELLRLEGIEL